MQVTYKQHTLKNKKVFLAGRFAGCTRKAVIAKLEMAGALCRDKLTASTDIVVIGAGAANPSEAMLHEAQTLQNKGKLLIMQEEEFLRLIGF